MILMLFIGLELSGCSSVTVADRRGQSIYEDPGLRTDLKDCWFSHIAVKGDRKAHVQKMCILRKIGYKDSRLSDTSTKHLNQFGFVCLNRSYMYCTLEFYQVIDGGIRTDGLSFKRSYTTFRLRISLEVFSDGKIRSIQILEVQENHGTLADGRIVQETDDSVPVS